MLLVEFKHSNIELSFPLQDMTPIFIGRVTEEKSCVSAIVPLVQIVNVSIDDIQKQVYHLPL